MVEANEALDQQVLTFLKDNDQIADTEIFSKEKGVKPEDLEKVLKSLNVDEYINLDVIERKVIELTAEGKEYLEKGTPEFQYASAMEVGK